MRLLMLSHSPNDPDGGASRIYHVLGDGLRDRGHEIEVRHFEDLHPPSSRRGRLLVQRFAMPTWLSMAALRGSQGADLVMSSSGMAHPLFARLRRATTRPVLVNHIHGLSVYDHSANLAEARVGHRPVGLPYRAVTGPTGVRWDRRGVEEADHVIVQNLRDLDAVARTRSVEDVSLIPPGLHPDLLTGSEWVSDAADRVPGQILWFGTWESRKGAWYVPRALELLLQQHPHCRLVVGGTGLTQAEILAQFSPSSRRAVTVLPRVSRVEQMRWMNSSEIFLFPSLSEGFGLALAEAMAFGLAAVAGATGFAADHLTDGIDARVVPWSSEHVARALAALVESPAARTDIARRGRTLARQFTAARMVSEYEETFGRLVQANTSRAGL